MEIVFNRPDASGGQEIRLLWINNSIAVKALPSLIRQIAKMPMSQINDSTAPGVILFHGRKGICPCRRWTSHYTGALYITGTVGRYFDLTRFFSGYLRGGLIARHTSSRGAKPENVHRAFRTWNAIRPNNARKEMDDQSSGSASHRSPR